MGGVNSFVITLLMVAFFRRREGFPPLQPWFKEWLKLKDANISITILYIILRQNYINEISMNFILNIIFRYINFYGTQRMQNLRHPKLLVKTFTISGSIVSRHGPDAEEYWKIIK
jgi:hypothetical protein